MTLYYLGFVSVLNMLEVGKCLSVGADKSFKLVVLLHDGYKGPM